MNFWLGTHEASWLRKVEVPLFISHRRLKRYKRGLPVARGPWALDSGGFTEVRQYGHWVTTEDEYVAAVRRYADEIGQLAWAAPMDWMCEPFVVEKTGLTVEDHQHLTVDNYVRLSRTGLPFIPVLQGWTLDDYRRCVDLYAAAGVDLGTLPLVGIGSVCRRQHTGEIETILRAIAGMGIHLHGFGVKTTGLTRYSDVLTSADSLAWSYQARRSSPLAGCWHGLLGEGSCANCPRFALRWRDRVLRSDAPRLPFGMAA